MRKIFLLLLTLILDAKAQNFPKFGTDSLLEIATWNLEWFGDTANGPSDESTQFNNVLKVIKSADIDIWSLEEVSDQQTYTNLLSQLGTYSSSISTFSQTQKMAIIWKTSLFEKLKEEHILTSYYNDFAGRPPLMTTLRYKMGNNDTLYVISMHMKANTGTTTQKLDAYQRRKNAANYLKLYIEAVLKNKKYIVLGDWNDRLDYTIYDGVSVSPYKALMDDNYFFLSKLLADKGRKTYYTGSVIDHIMISDSLKKYYIDGSINVFDNANTYLSGFSYSTSDHYPVFASYKFFNLSSGNADTTTSSISESKAGVVYFYPNPCTSKIHVVNSFKSPIHLSLYNISGESILQDNLSLEEIKSLDVSFLDKGVYIVKITDSNGFIKLSKIIKVDQ